ncbi:MAG: CHAP domain-containing protein [Eubacterium sp.]|nr:CHAP domain-containing protein [Eubacterium sp.]
MRFTKKTFKRALRTFLQAVTAYALVEIKAGVDFSDKTVVKGFVIGLLAAGLAAVMNLETPDGEQGAAAKMSFKEFVNAYLGKGTDYDGTYGVQCVDLAKLYIDKVLGIKPQSVGNAHCYYDNFDGTYLKKHFIKIPYKNGVRAKRGDLVVWGLYYNGKSPYGHIAVATGVQDESSITTYDQNWGGAQMKKVRHSLAGVSGFLRPIEQENINPENVVKYFKRCENGIKSLVDALGSVGAKSGFSYRRKIAAVNGIKGYIGSAKQNLRLLSLLKKGKLIKP